MSSAALEELAEVAAAELAAFHARQPLKPGMPREELRRRAFPRAPAGAFERVVQAAIAGGAVRVAGDGLALARHEVTLSPAEEEALGALEGAARGAGLAGVTLAEAAQALGKPAPLLERVGRVLQDQGVLRRVGEANLVHSEHLRPLVEEVRRRWPSGTRLDVAGFKELTGLTRKYVIPLLEHLDQAKVTRRVGAERWVL